MMVVGGNYHILEPKNSLRTKTYKMLIAEYGDHIMAICQLDGRFLHG